MFCCARQAVDELAEQRFQYVQEEDVETQENLHRRMTA